MWVKHLTDISKKGIKAGEVKEYDDAQAQAYIDSDMAETHTAPDAIGKGVEEATDKLADKMAERLTKSIQTRMDDMTAKMEFKAPRIAVGADNEDADPTFGFKSVGEQVHFIAKACKHDRATMEDPRFKRLANVHSKAPSTYVQEGSGPDGGFLLAPNFSQQILAWSFNDQALLPLTDTYTTGSNSLTVPKDETTPWGTNGVQVYWLAEAAQVTQSKLQLGQDNIVLEKLTALVPVTDEQLQDSFVGLGNYIGKQAGQRIAFKVSEAIINGTGAGQPLGVINSGAIVSQAAEVNQTAATVNLANIANMIAHQPNPMSKGLRWLCHPNVMPQLVTMTNGNNSLWVAPGALGTTQGQLPTLMGIPLIVSQQCQTLGTVGDIFLIDFSQYLSLTKGDGIQSAMSIHLYFDYNVSTFRFNFRVGGQPWPQAAFTSQYGNYSMSPFVNLATRS